MYQYKCKKCGYVYDPQKGDMKNNIDPGIPFEALGEDWRCPICGVDKSWFIKGGTG